MGRSEGATGFEKTVSVRNAWMRVIFFFFLLFVTPLDSLSFRLTPPQWHCEFLYAGNNHWRHFFPTLSSYNGYFGRNSVETAVPVRVEFDFAHSRGSNEIFKSKALSVSRMAAVTPRALGIKTSSTKMFTKSQWLVYRL